MKQIRLIMGMPITIEVADKSVKNRTFIKLFDYFKHIDETFSTYKKTSEISRFNKGFLTKNKLSLDVQEILNLSQQTKKETGGYFDIKKDGKIDPSGIVKGWAIFNSVKLLRREGLNNFYVEAGGDIQVSGKTSKGRQWTIGIRNPFNRWENIKILSIKDKGVATSGTAIRGQHIYNPFFPQEKIVDILSLTVIGPNVYEADRFATAAFAMGKKGIDFIEKLEGFEGYMIDSQQIATFTSGFEKYTKLI